LSGIDDEEINNGQTRQIAGVSQGTLGSASLEIAKTNLRAHFLVPGIVERFDESVLLMKRYLGWRMPFYVKKNVATANDASTELDEGTRNLILKSNRLDEQLYAFANELLTAQINYASPSFGPELRLFRFFNRVAGAHRSLRQLGGRLGGDE
jgi:hypothetical protein